MRKKKADYLSELHFRGADYETGTIYSVKKIGDIYKISTLGHSESRRGEISFLNGGVCVVEESGSSYNGAWSLNQDCDKLTINIPGFTRGEIELLNNSHF